MSERLTSPDVMFRAGVREKLGIPNAYSVLIGEVVDDALGLSAESHYGSEPTDPDSVFEAEVRRVRIYKELDKGVRLEEILS